MYRCARIERQDDDTDISGYIPIVLLLIIDDEGNSHYVWAKSLSALLANRKGYTNNYKKYFCLNCLSHKYSPEALEEHEKFCWKNGATAFPKEGAKMMFKNYKNKWSVLFVIYEHFESIQEHHLRM